MRTGRVIGAEALIRWQHPEKGLLPPAAFLPVIEDHPLAVEVGEWVIHSALTQVERWSAAGLCIPVSVNIGARQLQQSDFVGRLNGILQAHPGVDVSCLELEVLETSALQDLAHVSKVIADCQQIGVLFSLDDFGTGYSSLSYLKRLPVAAIKIDQSFVRDMLDDPDDLTILEGVISLARAFRRQVIAEGVETMAHGELLLQLGCDQAQGYGIARPMPAAELPNWSTDWRAEAEWLNLPVASREDLPLLNAAVEHRAWIKAAGDFIKGEQGALRPPDIFQCRFGVWLDSLGQERYGSLPAFVAVKTLHQQVHDLLLSLCKLNNGAALAKLDELHELRDALLAQLSRLMREIWH
jgi:EAL domain-containing protein (putative c-di-GMP-specific phosphodiesterase class I)